MSAYVFKDVEMDESPDWAVGGGVQDTARRVRHAQPQQIRAAMHIDQTRTASSLIVADTNVYIHNLPLLASFQHSMGPGKGAAADMGAVSLECFVIVPQVKLSGLGAMQAVWRELDSLKVRAGRQQAAHSAIRMVNDHNEHSPQPFFIHQSLDLLHQAEAISVTPDGVKRNSDDTILQCCLLYQRLLQARPMQSDHSDVLVLLTNDENLIGKAQAAGVQAHRSDALSPRDPTALYQQLHVPCQAVTSPPRADSGQSVLQHQQLLQLQYQHQQLLLQQHQDQQQLQLSKDSQHQQLPPLCLQHSAQQHDMNTSSALSQQQSQQSQLLAAFSQQQSNQQHQSIPQQPPHNLQQSQQQQQQVSSPQYPAQHRQVSQPMSPQQRPLPHLHGSGSAPAALMVAPSTSAAVPGSAEWLGAATEALKILLVSLQPAVAAVLSHTLGADIWQDCLAPRPPWRDARQMLDALRQARDSLGLSHQDSADFFRVRGELWAQAGELRRHRSRGEDAPFVRRLLEACRQMLCIARRCVASHAAAPNWPEACDAVHIVEQLQADDDHLRLLAKRLLRQ